MAGDVRDFDFWDMLEEAEQIVERWPLWQQRYDVDIYYEEEPEVPMFGAMLRARTPVFRVL
ncbi:MAG TPA: hypothetical protein VJZ00_13560 [Thermoanaerobaculia bacterium]|nr:hypothetical protein [Thermoanaerobaculia bacterium]